MLREGFGFRFLFYFGLSTVSVVHEEEHFSIVFVSNNRVSGIEEPLVHVHSGCEFDSIFCLPKTSEFRPRRHIAKHLNLWNCVHLTLRLRCGHHRGSMSLLTSTMYHITSNRTSQNISRSPNVNVSKCRIVTFAPLLDRFFCNIHARPTNINECLCSMTKRQPRDNPAALPYQQNRPALLAFTCWINI